MTTRLPGDFNPFEEAERISETDFDIDELTKHLELQPLQSRLLLHYLHSITIAISFNDEMRGKKLQHVGIGVFASVGPDNKEIVASSDLCALLADAFTERNMLGDEDEIVALEHLKRVIDEAIEERRNNPVIVAKT